MTGATERFDVVVVGGRVAGSAAAVHLSRAGLSVLVLERETLPRDTLSTHTVQDLAAFERLGVLDAMYRTGARPMKRSTLWIGDQDLSADHSDLPWLSIRRVVLDDLLIQAAGQAGADVRTAHRVDRLHTPDGRVEGVRYRTPDGETKVALCNLLVGADGRSSTIAKLVGARRYNVTWNERGAAWRYVTGIVPPPEFFFDRNGESLLLAAPCDHGRTLLAVQPSLERTSAYRAPGAIEQAFCDDGRPWGLAQVEWKELLASARPAGDPFMMLRYQCFFRTAAEPGWVLLGDAGHVKDVVTGQGISDAVRQAESLRGHVLSGWGNQHSLDSALGYWWRARDRHAAAMYWLSQDMGQERSYSAVYRSFFERVARSERLKSDLQEVLSRRRPVRRFVSLRRSALVMTDVLRRPDTGLREALSEMSATAGTEVRRRFRSVRPRFESPTGPRSGSQTGDA